MASDTMNAVVFNGAFQIATERRPKPKILEPTDAIIKVSVAGICGSDLHFYRGHQKMDPGVICVSFLRNELDRISNSSRDMNLQAR